MPILDILLSLRLCPAREPELTTFLSNYWMWLCPSELLELNKLLSKSQPWSRFVAIFDSKWYIISVMCCSPSHSFETNGVHEEGSASHLRKSFLERSWSNSGTCFNWSNFSISYPTNYYCRFLLVSFQLLLSNTPERWPRLSTTWVLSLFKFSWVICLQSKWNGETLVFLKPATLSSWRVLVNLNQNDARRVNVK